MTLRSLGGVGVSDESYGMILTPIITAKVPRELHLILSRDLSNEWDLSGLLEIFGKEQALQEKLHPSQTQRLVKQGITKYK